VVDHVQQAVKAAVPHLPDDYADMAIKARVLDDTDLVKAFDERAQNPEKFIKAVSRIRNDIVSRARRNREFAEGANVAADRELIAATLRGASSSVTPPEPKPNYGSMTDAEFAAEKKRIGLDG
jgi:hypothetical protein